jgi:hypothetical protein
VSGADDVPALRAALTAAFESVAVIPQGWLGDDLALLPADAIPTEDDLTRLAIVPEVRAELVAPDHPQGTDVGPLPRVPIAFGSASDGEKENARQRGARVSGRGRHGVLKPTCGWNRRRSSD